MTNITPERARQRQIRRPYEVGDALRLIRESLGMTQTQAAAAAGVSRKWLCEAEAGKPTVRLGMVLGVLDTLGYEMEFVQQPDEVDLGALIRRASIGYGATL